MEILERHICVAVQVINIYAKVLRSGDEYVFRISDISPACNRRIEGVTLATVWTLRWAARSTRAILQPLVKASAVKEVLTRRYLDLLSLHEARWGLLAHAYTALRGSIPQ